MSKSKIKYFCAGCGYTAPKWMGKCPECQEWNSFMEEEKNKSPHKKTITNNQALRVSDIKDISFQKIKTGIFEFDRVMGDGITTGSLNLIGGEPGVGKSTLLMEVSGKLSEHNRVLYISGEESSTQVAGRAKRLGITDENFYLLHASSWQKMLNSIKEIKPNFIIIDSIQTTFSEDLASPAGTLSQVREVTYEIMNYVKDKNLTAFLVGHITKDRQLAGPKTLEHMVDAVLYFEGDQFGQYRMLRGIKNRFGNTNEVGIFEMDDTGIKEVLNPSQFFLDTYLKNTFGKSLTCILEGARSFIVEIQALVIENKYGNGKRTTQGFDQARLDLLVAVIEKYFEIPLSVNDIYINITGGMKLNTRESDLSVLASIISSYREKPIDGQTLFIGEIGLSGEIRNTSMFNKRLKEAEQLGYKVIITSKKHALDYDGKSEVKIIGLSRAVELNKYLWNQKEPSFELRV